MTRDEAKALLDAAADDGGYAMIAGVGVRCYTYNSFNDLDHGWRVVIFYRFDSDPYGTLEIPTGLTVAPENSCCDNLTLPSKVL